MTESFEDVKRELTLQYQPLTGLGESDNTPQVADGTEIKLFAETIKEIFQKEPILQPIQKGPSSHFEGDKTLVVDNLKAKHKFEITAWVYSNQQGKHSLDDSILANDGAEAQTSTDTITGEEFDKFIPLGDTGIKYDSENVSVSGGSSMKRGFKKNIQVADANDDFFKVNGDETDVLANGDNLQVTGSTGNDGSYNVSSVTYQSGNDQTKINVQGDVTDGTNDGQLAANEYGLNYSRGEIKFFDTGQISTTTQTTSFLGQTISSQTVINDDFDINYTFDASANNIARLLRRMGQLGNPLVMRVDKSEFTAKSGEVDGRDYLVIPKKVSINSKSEKPAEHKVELELRKGTIER